MDKPVDFYFHVERIPAFSVAQMEKGWRTMSCVFPKESRVLGLSADSSGIVLAVPNVVSEQDADTLKRFRFLLCAPYGAAPIPANARYIGQRQGTGLFAGKRTHVFEVTA